MGTARLCGSLRQCQEAVPLEIKRAEAALTSPKQSAFFQPFTVKSGIFDARQESNLPCCHSAEKNLLCALLMILLYFGSFGKSR
jgi:hypothetical protein